MLAGEIIIACACVNFLWLIANVALTVVNRKARKTVHEALVEANTTLNEIQKRLTELNHPQYSVCPTCGKIALGACPECATLSKLIG
jgi:rubrerythrin